jgi:hypothetical protein
LSGDRAKESSSSSLTSSMVLLSSERESSDWTVTSDSSSGHCWPESELLSSLTTATERVCSGVGLPSVACAMWTSYLRRKSCKVRRKRSVEFPIIEYSPTEFCKWPERVTEDWLGSCKI